MAAEERELRLEAEAALEVANVALAAAGVETPEPFGESRDARPHEELQEPAPQPATTTLQPETPETAPLPGNLSLEEVPSPIGLPSPIPAPTLGSMGIPADGDGDSSVSAESTPNADRSGGIPEDDELVSDQPLHVLARAKAVYQLQCAAYGLRV